MPGSFVVPYLFDIEVRELEGPLEQFQVKRADKEGTRKLVEIINRALGEKRFDSGDLRDRFEALWPDLDKRIKTLRSRAIAIDVKNERGITLRDAIRRVGLSDIENREDEQRLQLPPEAFYRKATREIVVTGVSAYRTFESWMMIKILRNALDNGKRIYILILHPDAPDVRRLSKIEQPIIRNNLNEVIAHIKGNRFHEDAKFHIRFMQTMPPFQAVMIDGDVSSPEGSTPEDQDGQIRVQPRTQYTVTHRGVVMKFRKTISRESEPTGGFDYFAQDLRKQWRCHGKEYSELFV